MGAGWSPCMENNSSVKHRFSWVAWPPGLLLILDDKTHSVPLIDLAEKLQYWRMERSLSCLRMERLGCDGLVFWEKISQQLSLKAVKTQPPWFFLGNMLCSHGIYSDPFPAPVVIPNLPLRFWAWRGLLLDLYIVRQGPPSLYRKIKCYSVVSHQSWA